jgi:hypothetical protein
MLAIREEVFSAAEKELHLAFVFFRNRYDILAANDLASVQTDG